MGIINRGAHRAMRFISTTHIMKRIEFIAPVNAMRGNLSGGEKIRYQTQGNTAWYSDEGAAAQNYGTRYIGNKRAKNGELKYFSVRQNLFNTLESSATSTGRLTAASFAISASAYSFLIQDALLSDVKAAFAAQFPDKATRPVFDRWMRSKLIDSIRNKVKSFTVGVTGNQVTIVNPLYEGSAVSGLKPGISGAIRQKFAAQIAVLTPTD